MYKKNETLLYDVKKLKPTQFCLGFKEVEFLIDKILKMSSQEYIQYLQTKTVPVVVGPGNEIYLIDRHHHSKSVLDLKRESVLVKVVENFSELSMNDFFIKMNELKYLNLFDENQISKNFEELPKSLLDMKHDWFRSLSYAVRESKGYSKQVDSIPFYEFRWGEIYRQYLKESLIKDDFELALKIAMELTKSDLAQKMIKQKIKDK
jgi:hypothetical protein